MKVSPVWILSVGVPLADSIGTVRVLRHLFPAQSPPNSLEQQAASGWTACRAPRAKTFSKGWTGQGMERAANNS